MAIAESSFDFQAITQGRLEKIISKWRPAEFRRDKRFTQFHCLASWHRIDARGILQIENHEFGQGSVLLPLGLMAYEFRDWQTLADTNQRLLELIVPNEDGWYILHGIGRHSNSDLDRFNFNNLLIKNLIITKELTAAGKALSAEVISRELSQTGWGIGPG